MKVGIIGLGYVGVTAAACLAQQGHQVVGVDVNSSKVDLINSGRSPITEGEVDSMIARAVEAGHLRADSSLKPYIDDLDTVIVCVGTPSASDGSHNMSFIVESARQIASLVGQQVHTHRITVAFRSTFQPGTMEHVIAPIFRELVGDDYEKKVELVYNPEFLREATAVEDYFKPPKIVIGTASGSESAAMRALHEGINAPTFVVGFREAELTKFVDNSWHATKVAFANEIGRICAAYGVDSDTVHEVFVSDTKLNISAYYLRPGGAFGGSCLPKDVRATYHIADQAGVSADLLGSLMSSNESHKRFQLERVLALAPEEARILIAGLAFKAGTDDLRESPAIDLVLGLRDAGHRVRIFDPAVESSALVGQNLGHLSTRLPGFRDLFVTAGELASERFDLVVATNSTGRALPPSVGPVIDISKI